MILSDKENHNILIVDDVAENVELLKYLLSSEGFNTFTASSAEEARLILVNTAIDVLLLDVNMPVQDGFSFCRELRSIDKYKLLPIIFITSIEREIGFEEAMRNGGDDFINNFLNRPSHLNLGILLKIKRRTPLNNLLHPALLQFCFKFH